MTVRLLPRAAGCRCCCPAPAASLPPGLQAPLGERDLPATATRRHAPRAVPLPRSGSAAPLRPRHQLRADATLVPQGTKPPAPQQLAAVRYRRFFGPAGPGRRAPAAAQRRARLAFVLSRSHAGGGASRSAQRSSARHPPPAAAGPGRRARRGPQRPASCRLWRAVRLLCRAQQRNWAPRCDWFRAEPARRAKKRRRRRCRAQPLRPRPPPAQKHKAASPSRHPRGRNETPRRILFEKPHSESERDKR